MRGFFEGYCLVAEVAGRVPPLGPAKKGSRAWALHTSQGSTIVWLETVHHPASLPVVGDLKERGTILVGPDAGVSSHDVPSMGLVDTVEVFYAATGGRRENVSFLRAAVDRLRESSAVHVAVGSRAMAVAGRADDVRRVARILDFGIRVARHRIVSVQRRNVPTRPPSPRRAVTVTRAREFRRETGPFWVARANYLAGVLRESGAVAAAADLEARARLIAEEIKREWTQSPSMPARAALQEHLVRRLVFDVEKSLVAAGLVRPEQRAEIYLAALDVYANAAYRRLTRKPRHVVVLAGYELQLVPGWGEEEEVIVEFPMHLVDRAGAYPLVAVPLAIAEQPDRHGVAPSEAILAGVDRAAAAIGPSLVYAIQRFGLPTGHMLDSPAECAARRRVHAAKSRSSRSARVVTPTSDPVEAVAELTERATRGGAYLNEVALSIALVSEWVG